MPETSEIEMLYELCERARRTYTELDKFIEEQKRYVDEAISNIIATFASKEDELRRFGGALIRLLEGTNKQATERLEKLLRGFQRNEITVTRRGKVLRVSIGERWHVVVSYTNRYVYHLLLHGLVEETFFPDLLTDLRPEEKQALRAGWRASDESLHPETQWPKMTTTQIPQLIAWAALYPSLPLRIYVTSLHLNKKGPALSWQALVRHPSEPLSSLEAIATALRHPLGTLTLFLGDGCCSKGPRIAQVRPSFDVQLPKKLVKIIVETAYQRSYGKLLDCIKFKKWLYLKDYTKIREDPVHARIGPYTFWLCYTAYYLSATTTLNRKKDVQNLLQQLAEQGVEARVYRRGYDKYRYWVVVIKGSDVLKLASQNEEWQRALEKLARKKAELLKNLPLKKGHVSRYLRELAESPPLLTVCRNPLNPKA